MPKQKGSTIDGLLDLLQDRKRLTSYQAEVLRGNQPPSSWLIVGEYVIKEKLGAGGMGVVYEAYDRRMDREVAIKMLLDSSVQSADKIERFRREAIAAARLIHPNIITAFPPMSTKATPIW